MGEIKMLTFCQQTPYHLLGQDGMPGYKIWVDVKPDGTKSYLGALGRISTDAFRERHHEPLGHLSQLQLLYHFSRSCQNEAKISPAKE